MLLSKKTKDCYLSAKMQEDMDMLCTIINYQKIWKAFFEDHRSFVWYKVIVYMLIVFTSILWVHNTYFRRLVLASKNRFSTRVKYQQEYFIL